MRNRNRRSLSLLAPLLGGAMLAVTTGLAASGAHAAEDTTGPSLSIPARSSYVIGQVTDDPLFVDGELWFADRGAYRQFTWKASDASGICRYTVDEWHNVDGWYLETERYSTHATTGTFTYKNDAYENSDDLGQIRVNAYDCAGNVTSVIRPTDYINIERDYGPTVPAGWARTSCTCAIGDTMLRTSTRNTSLSTVVNGQGRNGHVALVMAKGPARGKAAIYFDGKLATTVDTYAKANTNRVVVWDKALAGTVNHTVRVVNLATSGRQRIDVDAYLR
jgi:hypothetical protein